MMQGWLFHSKFWNNSNINAYLSGVPNDAMIILDLDTENWPVWTYTSGYFGKVGGTGGLTDEEGLYYIPFDFLLLLALDLEFAAQLWW